MRRNVYTNSGEGPLLFRPINLRRIELANRVVVSPMAQYSAENGRATEWHRMHLESMAVSGAGLVISEFAAVQPEGRISYADLGIWSDETAESLLPIIGFFRDYSEAKFGVQLSHSGRKGSTNKYWEGHLPLEVDQGGWQLSAPSAIPYSGRATPTALNEEMLERLLDDYVRSIRLCDQVGVDVIEIHAAHGYLLHSFLSPLSNQREDKYGGSLENRMRFVLDVFDCARAVWPENKPIGVRISACDWIENGWQIDDSIVLATELRARGCDYITASSGGIEPEQQIKTYAGYQVPLARRIREESGLTTMAVGLITEAEQAEQILAEGSADMIALGRGMLSNPRWPWNAAQELGGECYYPRQYERVRGQIRSADFLVNPNAGVKTGAAGQ